MKKIKLSMEKRHIVEAYIFMLPFIIGLVMFFIYPFYTSIKLSLGEMVSLRGFVIRWSGFEHYIRAFVWDINFLPMLYEILGQVALKIPLIIASSLFLAIMINKNIKLKGFLRTAFFVPFLLGKGLIMEQILDQEIHYKAFASVKDMLFSTDVVAYFGPKVISSIDTFFSLIVIVLWSSGVQILLFLSGLQGIPASLYESAHVDGCNEWDKFWKITLPMMMPIILVVIVYTIVDSFMDITNPILIYIKDLLRTISNYEYASAIGWIYFLSILVILLVIFILMKRSMYSNEQKGVRK